MMGHHAEYCNSTFCIITAEYCFIPFYLFSSAGILMHSSGPH